METGGGYFLSFSALTHQIPTVKGKRIRCVRQHENAMCHRLKIKKKVMSFLVSFIISLSFYLNSDYVFLFSYFYTLFPFPFLFRFLFHFFP